MWCVVVLVTMAVIAEVVVVVVDIVVVVVGIGERVLAGVVVAVVVINGSSRCDRVILLNP